jgi:hypothetical protein
MREKDCVRRLVIGLVWMNRALAFRGRQTTLSGGDVVEADSQIDQSTRDIP